MNGKAPRAQQSRPRTTYSMANVMKRSSPIGQVLGRLQKVRKTGNGQWSACCPAHDDAQPSLSVGEGDDGRVLLTCHTGCETKKILAALRLQPVDLFPRQNKKRAPAPVKEQTGQKETGQRTAAKGFANAAGAAEDWAGLLRQCRKNLTRERLDGLAEQLGVSAAALEELYVGWCDDGNCPGAYVFPEFDGEGRIVGLATRTEEGDKSFFSGGHRGLYLPRRWRTRPGPIVVPEGASDTAALTAMDLAAVGRPSATGGIGLLADLLAGVPAEQEIVILGELDPKPDGRWPGREGAEKVAKELSGKLRRQINWALPPDGAKDVRAWLQAATENEDSNE